MPKLMMQDDCFGPYGKTELKFKGLNPLNIYRKTTGIVMEIFELEEKDVWERDFRWDTTDEPRGFYIRIIANKGMDIHSTMRVEITFQGKQPSDPTKEGQMTIGFYARMNTSFEMNTWFRKLPIYYGFLRLYNFLFYNQARRTYLKYCREYTQRLMQTFREMMEAPGMEDIMEKPNK